MYVDINRGGEKMRINIDVTMHHMPCHIVSLDLQDVMGSHEMNIGGTIYKNRLDVNGKRLSKDLFLGQHDTTGSEHHEHGHPNINLEEAKEAIEKDEGCRINGFILVNKVPGNFHISSHGYHHVLHELYPRGAMDVDTSHTINHISFGSDAALKEIAREFPEHGVLMPLDNMRRKKDKTKEQPATFE